MENLTFALRQAVPGGFEAEREMTVRLDKKSRPEPDILVSSAAYDPDRTWCAPEELTLVVEVVSEESADRDRSLKPFKYAQAGIPHFWRIEDEGGAPTVHAYELDAMTGSYVATGIHRARLKLAVPFPLDLDLHALVPWHPAHHARPGLRAPIATRTVLALTWRTAERPLPGRLGGQVAAVRPSSRPARDLRPWGRDLWAWLAGAVPC
ncbi:Putative restriction endonuclease [Streptomyces qinglanensis]|uniref:Putative restriction endonuclease n=1 Tax=Streptomyces qinglanensis TaxID=943816 RepID=A0A1H9NRF0_9ACTN|nr:Putative restriction endonuclease [Streptomyces qinglanensis]